MSTDSSSGPVILAVASGKGGVGKTMLTVACAYELSLKVLTLVIDLDFFNRGLSGLLRERREVGLVARPRYLDAPDAPPARPWRIVEVEDRLFHVVYPDLLPDELVRLEGRSVAEICVHLREFIACAAQVCGCAVVVLDCHGGPDHTSFAAAVLAEHTLLISEPDRITLHGTLNFLRQLRRAADQHLCDVRLVFNKVISAFRPRFLKRVYQDLLKSEFAGKPLLAFFPLELPLTKAFEETPILTAVYPYSLLAKKIRVLLRDLFEKSHPELLTRANLTLPKFVVRGQRKALGKAWWVLNPSVPLALIVIGAMITIPLSIMTQSRLVTIRCYLWSAVMIVGADQHPEISVAPESLEEKVIKDPMQFSSSNSIPSPGGDSAPSYGTETHAQSLSYLAPMVALGKENSSPYLYKFKEAERLRDILLDKWSTLRPTRYGPEWQTALAILRPRYWDPVTEEMDDFFGDALLIAIIGLIVWLGVNFYIQWSVGLDRGFTYAARRGANTMTVLHLLAAVLLWQLPSYLIAFFLHLEDSGSMLFRIVAASLALVVGTVAFRQCYLIYRDLHYLPHWRESCGRLIFVFLLPAAGLIAYLTRAHF